MNVSSKANSFCERTISAPPRHTWWVAIQTQVVNLEHRGPLHRPATHERAQAGKQLGERERLRQVVVGAAVESGHAILDSIAGGQHQYRGPGAGFAQPPASLEAVDPSEHHVEDDRVVGRSLGHPQCVLPPDRHVGRQSLLVQPATDQPRHLDLVLHDQHAHVTMVTWLDEW
jgi:hypothetical protein